MIVFLNGNFVPETEATVSVFDRSFLYGDGLFETLRVFNGIPFRWDEHLDRLQRGAALLKIKIPFDAGQLFNYALELIERNQMPESLLRINLSRGVGPRGYSPRGADSPTLVMTLNAAPDSRGVSPLEWRVITASCRLPAGEAIAEFKTANKLPQILARAEAEARGADEALLLNTNDEIVEAATSNLFWIQNGAVCTAPLSSGVLGGVTRLVVREICESLNLPWRELVIRPAQLRLAEGVFLSMSALGIVEIISLDDHELTRSPVTKQIQSAYQALTTLPQ